MTNDGKIPLKATHPDLDISRLPQSG